MKRQFCMVSKYSVVFKSKKKTNLSFWNTNYVSRIRVKIRFKDKMSRNVSVIGTMLVRTLYGAEKIIYQCCKRTD